MLKVGIFIIQYLYSWDRKLQINHGILQVGSDLEISSYQPFVRKGSYMRLWHSVQIQWMVVLIERHFFLTLGWKVPWCDLHPLPFVFSLCLLVDREGGCAGTAVLGWDSGGEGTQLLLSFLQGQHLQPWDHLCAPPLDLLQSVPSFFNCEHQNKDFNVKMSQWGLYLLIVLGIKRFCR